jgi:predicted DNA-binding protein (MmcQ/YjbR family)
MDIDWLRKFCLELPHTTEQVQWQDSLVFKVGGKMYAVASLEPGPQWLALKCTPEDFADLIERPGISPAPYLARAHWVALETSSTLSIDDLKTYLTAARDQVFLKLSKKQRESLQSNRSSTPRRKRKSNRKAAGGKRR